MASAYGGSAYPQEDDELSSSSQTGAGGGGNAAQSGSGQSPTSGYGAAASPTPYMPSPYPQLAPTTASGQNYGTATDTSTQDPTAGYAMPTPYAGGTTVGAAPASSSAANVTGYAGASAPSTPAPYAPTSTSSAASAPSAGAATATDTGGSMQAPTGATNPQLNAATQSYGYGTADTPPPIPTMYNGESTAVAGSYAQNAAQDAAGGIGGTLYTLPNGQTTANNPATPAMNAISSALGTAAGVSYNGTQASIGVGGTSYTMNPDGSFTGGGQTVSADQLKAQLAASGAAPVQQYNDVAQIAGQSPQSYLQQLSNANPNASATQSAGMSALAAQSGSTVPAPQSTSTSPAVPPSTTMSTPAPYNPALPPGPSNMPPPSDAGTGSIPANQQQIASPTGGASNTSSPAAPPSISGAQPGMQGTAQVSGNNLLQDYQSMLQNTSQGNLAGASGVNTNQILQGLLTGSNALQGPTQQTQSAINNLLQNPSAYNSAAVQQTYNNLGGQIDDQYALQQQQLTNNMAQRGLSDSSIAGGKLSDLNIGQRSAKEQLAASLATQQAQDLSSATQSAINLGLTGSGQQQTASAQNYAQQLQGLGFNQNNATTNMQQQQQILQAILGYGQQGFNNDVTTQQLNQQQQNEQDQLQLQLLGLQ